MVRRRVADMRSPCFEARGGDGFLESCPRTPRMILGSRTSPATSWRTGCAPLRVPRSGRLAATPRASRNGCRHCRQMLRGTSDSSSGRPRVPDRDSSGPREPRSPIPPRRTRAPAATKQPSATEQRQHTNEHRLAPPPAGARGRSTSGLGALNSQGGEWPLAPLKGWCLRSANSQQDRRPAATTWSRSRTPGLP